MYPVSFGRGVAQPKCAPPAQLLAVISRDCSRRSCFSCTQGGLGSASECVEPLALGADCSPETFSYFGGCDLVHIGVLARYGKSDVL